MEKLWERIKKSVTEGVTVAAEKTEEFTKLGKSKLDILNTKRKISKSFTELGGIIYDAVKDGKTKEIMGSSEVETIITTLKGLEANLDGKEQKYEELKKKPETEKKINPEDTDV